MGVLCLSLFWYALLCVLSSFAIILKRKRELVALLLLSYGWFAIVNVLWLFLTMPSVGMQCVIVVFPDHTHLLFHLVLPCDQKEAERHLDIILIIIRSRCERRQHFQEKILTCSGLIFYESVQFNN